ncbi:putative nuclease HARBI1 isoform X2 [Diabrotica virgifera virgifera]|uniref:DDE Tnp4 domain-containing protein n=1 Tax=Diabrotica virgifera virgifera TaxID=50390 RepID=A0ABM5L6G7_DIAVI|nr:putative nuclease HARBI1 isoform X2 [Diabrotica virgifera virgifera]
MVVSCIFVLLPIYFLYFVHIKMEENIALFFIDDNDLDMNLVGYMAANLAEPLQNDLQIRERHPRNRNENYYEMVIPGYTDFQFYEHFRMTREMAEELVHIVGNNHPLEDRNKLAPLRKKILFSIWILSKPESFLATGDRFGLPTSTGHLIFKEIINIICSLMPQYIRWPDLNDYAVSSQVFQERTHGFPGIIGAIDGCHIPIKQPIGNNIDFYNRKGFHSIILQGICDHTGKFIDVFIGMPGRMHDSRVFRNSPVFRRINNRQNYLIPEHFHLLGDAAYPLITNVMTPFRDTGHLTEAQTRYNRKLSVARSIIERTFGILKSKFRRLKYLDIANIELGNTIIAAACVLHNFTYRGQDNDEYNEELIDNINQNRQNVPQVGVVDVTAVVKRNTIVAGLED